MEKQQPKNLISGIIGFFNKQPLIAWNIFTLIFIFIFPYASLIFFLISIAFYGRRKKELVEQRRQQKIAEAENYIEGVRDKKALPIIKSSIFIEKDENVFLEEQTKLNEPRSIRKYSGTMQGVGFRISKRISIGTGTRSGTSESHKEWRTIDSGNLIITNKRLIFNGNTENRTIALKKIISITVALDGIILSIEERNKPVMFSVNNGYIWGAVMNIIKSGNDPLNLGGVNLDIQFK